MNERPTPETDFEGYELEGEWIVGVPFAERLERERDEARELARDVISELHDWLTVSRNWLNECRAIYGETYAWPVNNDDLDHIETILKKHDHLIQ